VVDGAVFDRLAARLSYVSDHFPGKLGLDGIPYLRFANAMIQPVWNRQNVARVQITMGELLGVQDRGYF
jgi:glucose-6-phosphate 1-dehydrogenase